MCLMPSSADMQPTITDLVHLPYRECGQHNKKRFYRCTIAIKKWGNDQKWST
jgi:hypothetical protein